MKDPGLHPKRLAFLGGVAQILINPRSSPRLADVGLFVRPKSQQSPLNKESPLQAQLIFTPEDQMLHRDPTLHCVRRRHTLCEVPNCSRSLLSNTACGATPIAKEHHYQISREPNISFTGAYCAFLRQWGGQAHCAFAPFGIYIVEHHPHTRLSSGHGSDTT